MTNSNSTLKRHGGRSAAMSTHRISSASPIVIVASLREGAGNV